ncbi:hypothetical protein V1281_005685 [Nitrobacteraceae bacterium AZCC 2161]
MSVLEVPDAGEHHGDPGVVGGLDDFFITDRSAGLDHRTGDPAAAPRMTTCAVGA